MRRGLAIVAALLMLTGCSGPGHSSRPSFDDVMKDPHASADAIITAAGPPNQVARDADGSVLVLWQPFIVPESEGPELEGATAWRLYDPRGRTVQTYSSPDLEDLSLSATQHGFLLTEPDSRNGFKQAYLIDTSGMRHRVAAADARRLAVRPGDVMVAGSEVQHFYRPADRSLHSLLPQPGAPRDTVQWHDAILDVRGALWLQGYEGRHHWLAWSRDGGRTLDRQTLPLEVPGATPSQPAIAVAHGVTVVLTDQVNGDAGQSVGPRYLDVVSGYGRRTRVTVASLPFLGRLSVNPDLSVTDDGRVLLGDYDAGEWWVASDASNRTFLRLRTPENTAFVRDLGGTLFAWGEWDHREATLRTSADDGSTWQTFDVTPPTS